MPSLLFPRALALLAILPFVALLHLLRERHRVTPVSSLILWRWAEKEVHGSHLRALSFSLLLFIHLLVAALLALALAQPILAGSDVDVGQNLILILDATTSMAAADVSPSRFAAAQARTAQLLDSLSAPDTFTLIEMRARSTILAQGEAEVAALARDLMFTLKPIGVGADWRSALALANTAVEPRRYNQITVLTDGAIPDLARAELPLLNAPLEWEIYSSALATTDGGQAENVAIVALTSRALPTGGMQVLARVVNFSDRDVQRTLTLTVDREVAEERTLELAGDQTFAHTWAITPGVTLVEVSLGGNDALPDDDRAALLLDPAPTTMKTLLVTAPLPLSEEAGSLDILARGLAAFPNIDLQTVAPEDYRPVSGYDLYVFEGFLPDRFPNGCVLLVNPPIGNTLIEAGEPVTSTSFIAVPPPDPLTAGIDWRSLRVDTLTPLTLPDWADAIVATSDGQPLIFRGRTGKTALIGLAFDLQYSNLPNRLAFPILLSHFLAELTPRHAPVAIEPGVPIIIAPSRYEVDVRITDPLGQEWVLSPGFEPTFAGAYLPGLYTARGLDASGKSWEEAFVVNVGASLESDLRPQPMPEVPVAELSEPVSTQGDIEMWPWLVTLLLILLALETWLAW